MSDQGCREMQDSNTPQIAGEFEDPAIDCLLETGLMRSQYDALHNTYPLLRLRAARQNIPCRASSYV
jgi:hypothetical protein